MTHLLGEKGETTMLADVRPTGAEEKNEGEEKNRSLNRDGNGYPVSYHTSGTLVSIAPA
ncbi:MAG: hypothetical protein ABI980_08675 [Nitrospirota bacterium]